MESTQWVGLDIVIHPYLRIVHRHDRWKGYAFHRPIRGVEPSPQYRRPLQPPYVGFPLLTVPGWSGFLNFSVPSRHSWGLSGQCNTITLLSIPGYTTRPGLWCKGKPFHIRGPHTNRVGLGFRVGLSRTKLSHASLNQTTHHHLRSHVRRYYRYSRVTSWPLVKRALRGLR
jgi:hypothetical protein